MANFPSLATGYTKPFNFIDAYWKTADRSCDCDWCSWKIDDSKLSGKLGDVRWHAMAKTHWPGISLVEADAVCCKITLPAIHVGPVGINLKLIGFNQTGFNCSVCNERNDYAESNQGNGTYVCFNCR